MSTIDPVLLARLDSIPLTRHAAEHLQLVLKTMEEIGGRWPSMVQPTYGDARDLLTAVNNLSTALHNFLSSAIDNDLNFKAANQRQEIT